MNASLREVWIGLCSNNDMRVLLCHPLVHGVVPLVVHRAGEVLVQIRQLDWRLRLRLDHYLLLDGDDLLLDDDLRLAGLPDCPLGTRGTLRSLRTPRAGWPGRSGWSLHVADLDLTTGRGE